MAIALVSYQHRESSAPRNSRVQQVPLKQDVMHRWGTDIDGAEQNCTPESRSLSTKVSRSVEAWASLVGGQSGC